MRDHVMIVSRNEPHIPLNVDQLSDEEAGEIAIASLKAIKRALLDIPLTETSTGLSRRVTNAFSRKEFGGPVTLRRLQEMPRLSGGGRGLGAKSREELRREFRECHLPVPAWLREGIADAP